MKILKIFILAFLLLNIGNVVQAQSFEKDWQWLKFTEKTGGTTSFAYENALLNLLANNLKDSLTVSYYDSIATRQCDIISQIEDKYGITSVQYWNLIEACGSILIDSKYKQVKLSKRKQLIKFLKSLEKTYNQAGVNEEVFAIGLSDLYWYLENAKKAVFWTQKRLEFAKKTTNVNNVAGAYCVLADLFISHHINEEFQTLLSEIIEDSVLLQNDKRSLLNNFLITNYEALSKTNKSDIANSILGLDNNRFIDIDALCHEAAKHHDYYIFEIIETSNCFSNFSLEDKFDYYVKNSTVFSIYNNPKRCVDYLLKAINHAQSNNRDDLNWHYHGTNATVKTHYWFWVAFYYEFELSDKVNALKYLEINLRATKDYYGENSINYYNDLKDLSAKYDLWYKDIEKVSQYDSIKLNVAKSIFDVNSEEYVNSLENYISSLRSKNQYKKALSLCYDYLSIADSMNVYLYEIYNQAAICFHSLGNHENALTLFFKAFNNADDEIAKSTIAENISCLLVEEGDINSALELLDKHQPKTKDLRVIYSFLNTKANILASIDREKAYSTFCNAEQIESDSNVQLSVDVVIKHYMDKARYAPDFHRSFSALQQALKIFDKNSTADSLLYANIIADMADYYSAVRDIDKSLRLYDHALEVYFRNSKDICLPLINFCDRAIKSVLSQRTDPFFVALAEWSLDVRKELQGETNTMYFLRKLELLEKFSKFGYESKADSLAKEIMSAQLPLEIEHKSNYYLGVYEQFSRKDLKKAANYYEKYLLTSNSLDFSMDVYGYLVNIYHELGEYSKFDNAENNYISMGCQLFESAWYHFTDQERKNYLSLLKAWQTYFAKYACTPNSIDNAVNASLFSKRRLTQTTKAINEELSRLGKNIHLTGTYSSDISDAIKEDANAISISDHIISSQDSINRSVVYNDLSTKSLKQLVNSNISQVKKELMKGDVGIDFVNVDTTMVYAYIIRKDKPIELKKLTFEDDLKTLSRESLEDISIDIKGAKRVFFSPSETMSVSPIESLLKNRFPKVEIHRVLSLCDIHKTNSFTIKNVVAIGNPRFNDELPTEITHDRGTIWQPLPGTKIEIDSISNMLKKNNIRIYTFTENNATESVIKDFSRKNIDLVHIATHGFFNSDNNESGLLFTGANRGVNEESLDKANDGILTCEEIENLIFPNLKLVVLSACETGLGKSNIDGVWGLQRAFRIAGAQNIIVSLKKVDDDLTQAFMINFYKNLTSGKSIYNSFWEAMANADEDTRNSFILIE